MWKIRYKNRWFKL